MIRLLFPNIEELKQLHYEAVKSYVADIYNPQNEMLPFHKTKCSETQNEASSL